MPLYKRHFLFGGGEESRTPVRRSVCKTFYEHSRRIESFFTARPSAGLRIRQPLDPARDEARPGWFPTLMMPVSYAVGSLRRTVAPLGSDGHIAVIVSYI